MEKAGHDACGEIFPVPGSSGLSGLNQEEATPLTWGWGFIDGSTEEPQTEGERDFQSGYHSAETTIISDSEDDLSFLDEVLPSGQENEREVQMEEEGEIENWSEEEWEWWDLEEDQEYEPDEEEEDDDEEDDDEEDDDDDEGDEGEKEDGDDEEEDMDEDMGGSASVATDLCVVCLARPCNASIIPGDTGHQVCCLECASRLKLEKKRCPVCRKKIKLVIKNFV